MVREEETTKNIDYFFPLSFRSLFMIAALLVHIGLKVDKQSNLFHSPNLSISCHQLICTTNLHYMSE